MNLCKRLWLIFFAVSCLQAQAPPPKMMVFSDHLLFAEQSTQNSINGGTSNICYLVMKDGSFRFEKYYQDADTRPDPKVYEGKLTDADMEQLRAILTAPDFRAVKSERKSGTTYYKDLNLLRATAYTQEDAPPQDFFFWEVEERKQYLKALKPFEEWLKSLAKRKIPQNKTAKANNCQPPEITQEEMQKRMQKKVNQQIEELKKQYSKPDSSDPR
jgi:hypothetical protein